MTPFEQQRADAGEKRHERAHDFAKILFAHGLSRQSKVSSDTVSKDAYALADAMIWRGSQIVTPENALAEEKAHWDAVEAGK